MISKETLKTFLLYFMLVAIVMLSVNTYLQNERLEAMQHQIDTLQQYIIGNKEILENNKNLLGNLSEQID